MGRRMAIYFVLFIAALIIILPILTAPGLINSGGVLSRIGISTYFISKGLCHQIPERSYYWNGIQFPVCHRCFGIYSGILIGLIVFPFTPYFRSSTYPSLKTFLIFALPVAIDLALGFTGIWEGYPYIRTTSGFLVGFIAIMYLVNGVDELLQMLFRGRG